MRHFKVYLLLLFIFILPRTVFSQAIRINYFGYQGFQSGDHARNITFGFGYEQDIWTKVSVSIDYNFGYAIADLEDTYDGYFELYDANTGSGYSYNYKLRTPWHEFSFISKYFFRENSENSWYVSTGIAYRSHEYNIDIANSGYSGTGTPQIPIGMTSQSGSSIPLSLKFGFRNGLDGMLGDYNFGINYLAVCDDFGSGNSLIDNELMDDDLDKLFFSFTCSFGFGWKK